MSFVNNNNGFYFRIHIFIMKKGRELETVCHSDFFFFCFLCQQKLTLHQRSTDILELQSLPADAERKSINANVLSSI